MEDLIAETPADDIEGRTPREHARITRPFLTRVLRWPPQRLSCSRGDGVHLLTHRKEARRLPCRDPCLHQPGRRCMPQGVRRDALDPR